MMALLGGDRAGAIEALGRGVSLLNTLAQQGPAHYRGLWPFCWPPPLMSGPQPRSRRHAVSGVTVNRLNRGLLGYAGAILAGRRGEPGAGIRCGQGS